MICTRPDIEKIVIVVSKFMQDPSGELIRRILKYKKGISGVALCFGGSELAFRGYVDLDFASNRDKRRSFNGLYLHHL